MPFQVKYLFDLDELSHAMEVGLQRINMVQLISGEFLCEKS